MINGQEQCARLYLYGALYIYLLLYAGDIRGADSRKVKWPGRLIEEIANTTTHIVCRAPLGCKPRSPGVGDRKFHPPAEPQTLKSLPPSIELGSRLQPYIYIYTLSTFLFILPIVIILSLREFSPWCVIDRLGVV